MEGSAVSLWGTSASSGWNESEPDGDKHEDEALGKTSHANIRRLTHLVS